MKKINNIFAYIIGYYRYNLFYSKHFKFLIRTHIRQQIEWRISIMNIECFESGSCVKCGCDTTALQMANKTCGGFCYPKMMNKKQWEEFNAKPKFGINLSDKLRWELRLKNGRAMLQTSE